MTADNLWSPILVEINVIHIIDCLIGFDYPYRVGKAHGFVGIALKVVFDIIDIGSFLEFSNAVLSFGKVLHAKRDRRIVKNFFMDCFTFLEFFLGMFKLTDIRQRKKNFFTVIYIQKGS